MLFEINKLQRLLGDVKGNLTTMIDNQIKTHEELKGHYMKLMQYAAEFENEKQLKMLERELLSSEENINKMKEQIDKINELARRNT